MARNYLLIFAVRKDTGVPDLPFFCGSARRTDDPNDLSDLLPERTDSPYPAVQWVVKAQWEAQKEILKTRTVILRDIAVHPMNVHDNTERQLKVGKLFAEAFLKSFLRIGGHQPQQILTMLGAKG